MRSYPLLTLGGAGACNGCLGETHLTPGMGWAVLGLVWATDPSPIAAWAGSGGERLLGRSPAHCTSWAGSGRERLLGLGPAHCCVGLGWAGTVALESFSHVPQVVEIVE
jgi:hypothetical protein